MLRNFFRLAILLLVIHALVKFVPPYMHYHQFKDGVEEITLFAKETPPAELVKRVMLLAEQYDIPIEPDAVQVTRDAQMTYINIAYEEQIEWLPSYTKPMAFSIATRAWRVPPPGRTDAIR